MKRFLSIAALFALTTAFYTPGALAVQDKIAATPIIIAASATSSSEGSAPIICLFDSECEGYWSPRSFDAGSNEGIYLRFQEPAKINFIEITIEGDPLDSVIFQTFLDAQSSPVLKAERKDVENDEDYAEAMMISTNYIEEKPDKNQHVYLISSTDTSSWEWDFPLDYAARSIFIKLAPNNQESAEEKSPKIVSIRFFDQEEWSYEPGKADTEMTPMALALPAQIKADASATSTLEPSFAYDVSKLFDSQPDMAWSTNGKKSGGVGEAISISFADEQEIHGMVLWNGYQRSDVHYKANGRIKTLSVAGQTVKVKDEQGPQKIQLQQPVKAKDIKLEITAIYPGGSYKDVLISELLFTGEQGRILQPVVQAPTPPLPPALEQVVDRGFIPLFLNAGNFEPEIYENYDEDESQFDSAMRFRSNGSFVIYTNTWENWDDGRSSIVEGNWESQKDGALRIFGKKYQTILWTDRVGYLIDVSNDTLKKVPAPKIFQSKMTVAPFASLSPEEQKNAVSYMFQTRWMGDTPDKAAPTSIATRLWDEAESGYLSLGGPNREAAIKNTIEKLKEINPLYVKSDVYTEILIPRAGQQ